MITPAQLDEWDKILKNPSFNYVGRVRVMSIASELIAEVRRLRTALEWYANEKNYEIHSMDNEEKTIRFLSCEMDDDKGQCARAALHGSMADDDFKNGVLL